MTDPQPTAFIVDDDPGVCRGLGILLRSAGYRVETFTAPREFLEAITLERPGCLLVDMRMPGLDGLELFAQLRRKGVTIPVIVVTGHADVGLAVRAFRAGVLHFIEKPVESSALLDAVASAIDSDAQARAAAASREEVRRRLAELTAREHAVAERLIAGRTTKEIAGELRVTPQAIDSHRKNVFRKLRVESIAELVRTMLRVSE